MKAVSEEFAATRPRVRLMTAVAGLLPMGMFQRTRSLVYRAFGVSVGRGVVCFGPMSFGWYGQVFENLSIGAHTFISYNVVIDTTAPVAIGEGVSIGHDVTIVTANHDASNPAFRAGAVQPASVSIGSGAWICAHAKILPGVSIGDGAIVGAGAVVSRDVPAHTLVGGVPARVIRSLAKDAAPPAEMRPN